MCYRHYAWWPAGFVDRSLASPSPDMTSMLKAIRNLDYVVLLCEDVDAMTRFYNDTLGFPLYRAWEGWVEMRAGATLLTLRKRGRPYDGPSAPGSAGVQLAFRVAPGEVDAC